MVGTNIADLAKAYPAAWRSWLGRKVDKALPVRLAWVESAKGILVTQPDLRGEMEGELEAVPCVLWGVGADDDS